MSFIEPSWHQGRPPCTKTNSVHMHLLSAAQIKPLQMHAFAKISLIFHFLCADFRAQLMLGYIHQVNAFSQTLWAENWGGAVS